MRRNLATLGVEEDNLFRCIIKIKKKEIT